MTCCFLAVLLLAFGIFLSHYSISSVQFSRSVVFGSLRPSELQHARPPGPSPTPGVHSDSTLQHIYPQSKTQDSSIYLQSSFSVQLLFIWCCGSVPQLSLCNPMDSSVLHHPPTKLAQIHVHCASDAIQLYHPLSHPSPALSLSQHQGLFPWVSCLHQVL